MRIWPPGNGFEYETGAKRPMKHLKNREKLKKTGAALAAVCMAAVLCVLLAVSGHTAPENPMENQEADASRMYLTSSTLAMDKEQLASVENANISSGGTDSAVEQEEEQQEEEQQEGQQGEEQQEEEQQEEEQQQKGQQQDAGNVSQLTAANPMTSSLKSLIHKKQASSSNGEGGGSGNGPGDGSGEEGGGENGGGPGGGPGGGDEKSLNMEQSRELFTTSLQNDRVTKPDYRFTISLTEKGKQLEAPRFTVVVNNSQQTASTGTNQIKLKQGANSVYVMLKFRARDNTRLDEYTAYTKVYTIQYIPDGTVSLRVINARTGEDIPDGGSLTVYQQSFWVQVIAEKNTGGTITAVSSKLRLSGVSQAADSDGIYRLTLTPGDQNVLRVVADVGGVEQAKVTCTIAYKTDSFMLRFDGPDAGHSETISNNKGKGDKLFNGLTCWDYESESSEFSVRLTYSKNTGKEKLESFKTVTRNGEVDLTGLVGGDGYAAVALAADQPTTFEARCIDSEGNKLWYKWEITYKRIVPPAEGAKNAPKIDVGLTDGEKVYRNPYPIWVKVEDAAGNWMDNYGSEFFVYLNGQYINFDSISIGDRKYEFNLYLTEGKNELYIFAKDANQYTSEKTITIYFNSDIESAKLHLILSAETVGLGTLIDEHITVPSGVTVAQIVEERLAAYSYGTIHDGSASGSDYFLRHIQKPGILEGWSISEEERSLLEMEGFWLDENPVSLNSLGEKDFTSGSGWMVTLNHYYIAQTMGTRAIRDGDEIHVLYTLDVGNDIGVEADTGIYG